MNRLQVTPATESTPVGLSKPFTARAFFTDGTSQDVTEEAALSWSTSDNSIATITTGQTGGNGIATGQAVGDVDIIASGTMNGRLFEVHSTLTVTAAEIDTSTFEVTPNPETTPVGLSKPFTAKVTLTDGVTVLDITDDPAVSWTVAPAGIATITSGQARNNGVATGVTSGTTVVTATGTLNGSTFTATADLTVTDAIINRLQVTPIDDEVAEGLTKQYTATAIFSDGTPQDVTTDANWLTSLPGIATIDADGLATSVAKGVTKIKAMYVTPEGNQVFDETTLTVTDAVITSLEVTPTVKSVPKGIEQQFEATAYYSNGDTAVVTTDTAFLSWTTSGTEVSVNATGLASGDEVGSATVIATANTATDPDGNTLTGAALLRVTDEQIGQIQVTPSVVTKPLGQRQAYVATAIMTDGSSYPVTNNKRVSWSTNPAGIATVTSGIPAVGNGIAKGVATGDTTITASMTHFGKTTTGTAAMTVTEAVPVSLEIQPLKPSIAKGNDQTFTAYVKYSDSNTYPADPADISWASATPTVATIDTTTGVAHGVETGTSVITLSGTVDGVTLDDVSTTLTVTAAEATSLYVVEDTSIAKGRTYPFKAYTVMTAGDDVEVTDSASWQALDPTDTSMASTVASLSTSTLGLATGDEVGTATIQATYGTFTASATLTVTDAVLESITVTPDPLDVGIGSTHTGNLIATGHYSDGSTPTITDLVNWVPGNTSIATVETEDPDNPDTTT
ncbi:Ig-like domain-containing protein, partial [Vibrio alginolyticus]|uniref:Ig-like domain-containing protein n=1 Tax=Vibrio alginolyticus TaxID=663 RepID=UPI002119C345